jgi:hypothetical protein
MEENQTILHGSRYGKVVEGGPDSVRVNQQSDRALLLSWPDYSGQGFFGRW